MHINELIEKKKHGEALTEKEIQDWIEAYVQGKVPDYQVSALLMAIYFQGLDDQETYFLTKALLESGDQVDLGEIKKKKVDKHSTGGVGDTISLVLGPLLAARGLAFAKMSGRGLGHTGGTLDKLEAIDGFSVEESKEDFIDQVNRIGLAIVGQTANITPGDKKLYSLRDATETVDQSSLIAASIISKKMAIESDALILDVKMGEGAFMKNLEEAQELAEKLVDLGGKFGRKVMAVISSMEEPLSKAIGNLIEVQEAIKVLQGKGSEDLRDLALSLGAKLLVLTGEEEDEDGARQELLGEITSGRALEKFADMVKAQGGQLTPEEILEKSLSPKIYTIRAREDGWLEKIHALSLGEGARRLGAGRLSMEDVIDPGAGLYLHKKVGDPVKKGEPILDLYGKNVEDLEDVIQDLEGALAYSKSPVERPTLIYREVKA